MQKQSSLEEAEQIVAAHERSGKTVREFCAERGITKESFYGFRSRIKQRASASSFAQVLSGSKITLELSSGKSITFAKELLPEILAGLTA